MNCRRVRKQLPAFVDGVLAPCKADAIERHLVRCAACRREAAFLRHLDAALSAQPVVEPPPHMASAIVTRAAARAAARRLGAPRWLEALTFAGVALGMAAAALAALAIAGAPMAWRDPGSAGWSVLALTTAGGLAALGRLYYAAGP